MTAGGFSGRSPRFTLLDRWMTRFQSHDACGLAALSLGGNSPHPSHVDSPPAAIGRDALVGHPHALGQFAGLPEHVDRDAAARIPVAADA